MIPQPGRVPRRVATTAAVAFAALLALPAAPALAAMPTGPSPMVSASADRAALSSITVDALNARYLDTSMACADDQPAYFCNGVVVRTTGTSLPSASQTARDGASFSYLRDDLGIEMLWPAATAGMILLPWGDQETPMRMRCAFPTDGATDSRPDSCDQSTREVQDGNPVGSSVPCAEQGIDSAARWSEHFATLAWKNGTCSFPADRNGFEQSLVMREQLPPETRLDRMWNEVVVGAWTVEATPELPVEAFFFIADKPSGLANAEALQDQFESLSGRVVPLVGIDFSRELPFVPVPAADLSVEAPAAVVGETRPVFSGRAEPGATITVLDADGRTLCAGEVSARGRWSCESAVELERGEYRVTVVETSGAGVESLEHSFEVRVLDAPRITSPAPGERLADNRVVVTGEAGPFVVIEVRDADGIRCLTFSQADGAFSCTVDPVLDGDHRWTATANQGVATSPATAIEFSIGELDEVDPVTPVEPVLPGDGSVAPIVEVGDAAASSDLARTGADLISAGTAAVLLVVGGGALILLRVVRRRSRSMVE